MRSTHEHLEAALRHIGVTIPIPSSTSWPVWEDGYLKMMGGPHFDRVATDQVELWLNRLGFHYQRDRDRAIWDLEPEAVRLIDRLWGLNEDGEIERPIDVSEPYLYPTVGYVTFMGTDRARCLSALENLQSWLGRERLGYVVDVRSIEIALTPPVLRRVAVEWLGHKPSQPAWAPPVVAPHADVARAV